MNSIKYFLLAFSFVMLSASAGWTHGVTLNANVRVQSGGSTAVYNEENLPRGAQVTAVEIIAQYTTGEPMSGAQVTVFAPGDRSTPWRTGTTNAQGRYTFNPDVAQRGNWVIRVQAVDHSNIITIPIL